LRKICDEESIVYIFDEVMTGFRLSAGGAQEKLGIQADLVTYGRIGAGMPVGAFGGKRAIMEHIAPIGNVYQAGTLSGNPIAMIAGYTLLKELKESSFDL
jgi:glutamate-1-semialdehyde 2,1-aminomutase